MLVIKFEIHRQAKFPYSTAYVYVCRYDYNIFILTPLERCKSTMRQKYRVSHETLISSRDNYFIILLFFNSFVISFMKLDSHETSSMMYFQNSHLATISIIYIVDNGIHISNNPLSIFCLVIENSHGKSHRGFAHSKANCNKSDSVV